MCKVKMNLFEQYFDINPRIQYYPEYDPKGVYEGYDCTGIQSLTYDGAEYLGKKTKVFAHIGFPANTDKPVPAIVLVHGAGGHPVDVWIRRWNERGYAAISMELTGAFPSEYIKPEDYVASKDDGQVWKYARVMGEPFAEEGYTNTPDNPYTRDGLRPFEEHWDYQAMVAVILAHNILRNDARVDADKIGVCGISWGGIVTSTLIGFDRRFAFAIPIYGSGYLGYSLSKIGTDYCNPTMFPWLAERYFHDLKMPVMWLCYNDDAAFSLHSNSLSYLDTKDGNPNTCLSIRHQIGHSHWCGYRPPESYWFADMVLNSEAIPTVDAVYRNGKVEYTCSAPVTRVRLFYLDQYMSYSYNRRRDPNRDIHCMDQEWKIVELDPAAHSADLPEKIVCRYMEFTLENGIVLTTPYYEAGPRE